MTGEAACTRDPGEDAGNYTITCAPGTLDAANYVFASGDTAQLTINQAIADCSSIAGQTVTYDGDSHGATGNCTGVGGGALPGLDRGDSFANVPGGTATWTFEGGTNYTDQGGSVLITIDPATLDVDAGADSKTYGQDDPAFTYTLDGFVNGEDETSAGVPVPPTAPANQARTSATTRSPVRRAPWPPPTTCSRPATPPSSRSNRLSSRSPPRTRPRGSAPRSCSTRQPFPRLQRRRSDQR